VLRFHYVTSVEAADFPTGLDMARDRATSPDRPETALHDEVFADPLTSARIAVENAFH
jgi:hypothetical protein